MKRNGHNLLFKIKKIHAAKLVKNSYAASFARVMAAQRMGVQGSKLPDKEHRASFGKVGTNFPAGYLTLSDWLAEPLIDKFV